jgi:hypothetical protein
MFTLENTEGFTSEEIIILNAALAIRVERGEDEKVASDKINNAWFSGASVEDLI